LQPNRPEAAELLREAASAKFSYTFVQIT
jgi:hypothetical protein